MVPWCRSRAVVGDVARDPAPEAFFMLPLVNTNQPRCSAGVRSVKNPSPSKGKAMCPFSDVLAMISASSWIRTTWVGQGSLASTLDIGGWSPDRWRSAEETRPQSNQRRHLQRRVVRVPAPAQNHLPLGWSSPPARCLQSGPYRVSPSSPVLQVTVK